MEGELRDRHFVRALRSIGRRRKTGILTVQGRDEIIAFSFAEGAIVGADALNQSLEEGLGEVLASQHLVDSSEFAALAAEHESGGGRVVDLLVERAFLSRGQLLESLRVHTYRLCLEALSWSSGEYRFYQGDEVAYEAGVEPIGVGELLVRASLELGGAGPLALPIPDLDEIFRRSSAAFAESGDDGAEAGSASASHRVLELLDGRRSLREVAASSDFSSYDIRDVASEWLEAGIIEKIGERPVVAGVEPVEVDPVLETPLADFKLESAPGLVPVDDLGSRPLETAMPAGAPSAAVEGEGQGRSRLPQPTLLATRWLNRVCGLGFLLATLVLLATGPARILLPFPWQGAVMHDFRVQQRSVQRMNLERGARTFFLLFGRYPESSDDLEARGLVSASDLDLESGGRWRISASPASFVLRAPQIEGTEDASWTSAIAGNFLLDPEFVRPSPTTAGPLLVLLD